MNYLGSNRVVTNSFSSHRTAEDYAGNHLSNVIMYGNGKVIRVINKFKSHEDSINYNNFLNNGNSWYKDGVYHCISITGKITLMVPDELGGNQVFVETYDGNQKLIFRFAHLDSVNVKVGDIINENTILGLQGNTGLVLSSKNISDETYGSHVHLEIIDENNNYVNPRKYASGEVRTTYQLQTNIKDENKLQFIVNVDVINIRESASVNSKDIGNVYINEIYDILGTITNSDYIWYKIKTNTGIEGYVAYLKNSNWLTIYEPKKEEIVNENIKLDKVDNKDEEIKGDITNDVIDDKQDIDSLNLIFECAFDDYYYIYLKKGEKLYLK